MFAQGLGIAARHMAFGSGTIPCVRVVSLVLALAVVAIGCAPTRPVSTVAPPPALPDGCTVHALPESLAMPNAEEVQGSYCAGAGCVGDVVAARRDDGVLIEVLRRHRVRLVHDDGTIETFSLRFQEPPDYELREHPRLPDIDGDRLILFTDVHVPDEHGNGTTITGERFTIRTRLLHCSLQRLRSSAAGQGSKAK